MSASLPVLTLQFQEKERNHLPADSPFILIANRMEGGLEDIALAQLLTEANIPVKLLAPAPGIRPALPDNAYVQASNFSLQEGVLPTKASLEKLIREQGPKEGCLVVCLEHGLRRQGHFMRHRFQSLLIKELRKLELPMVPAHLHRDHNIESDKPHITVRIGKGIKPESQQKFDKPSLLRKFLLSRIFALGSPLDVRSFYLSPSVPQDVLAPLAEPVAPELLLGEVESLPPESLIISQAPFDIYLAKAPEIPQIMEEIGRLRELTFRGVGEGTGMEKDIDEYDLYYYQMFIWDRAENKIVGGYRLGAGDEIFNTYGPEGFYISSLFKIKKGFYFKQTGGIG
ncbi:MAG: GNAT family N-acetyltransferase [Bacteroidia bacterium]